ncbi:hypothetical protein GCM10010425_54710 [Streptomyces spororaveus]|uniref:Secreted protein n=1 Tax=Streptomyces spororaveus TaxID=284039 RepID=A0ABQ3TA94_9ACTN|nr:hypothetical protein Sspor_28920 [Streptomyces spororaveus]
MADDDGEKLPRIPRLLTLAAAIAWVATVAMIVARGWTAQQTPAPPGRVGKREPPHPHE